MACWNGKCHPLDEYVADPPDWLEWNEWGGLKNDWTRPRILSFMQFYPRTGAWLFGGAFEVVDRLRNRYRRQSVATFEKNVGRLLASFHCYQGMRGRAFRLESARHWSSARPTGRPTVR